MSQKIAGWLPCLWAALLWTTVACQPAAYPEEAQEEPTGSAQVVTTIQQAVSLQDVSRVEVTVSAADMGARTVQLVRNGSRWTGVLGRLPVGTDRTFSAQAFDSAGTVLYAGGATGILIVAGQTTTVSLTLQEMNPPPPFENAAPCITALIANPSSVAPGGLVSLQATAMDPNAGDTLTYAWSSSSGTIVSAVTTSLSATWKAPPQAGLATILLTVTDSKGATATVSVTITVVADQGSAAVSVTLNSWPQVASVMASPSNVAVNQSTALTATASDNDGDTLSYAWTSSCAGTFDDPTSATPHFTPTAQPSSNTCGNCTLTVTVDDGRGGHTTGSLAICVGATPPAQLPPQIVETFSSDVTVAPNGSLILRVRAEDPQASPLSFSWNASGGTLGAPNTGANTTEVVWTAPACLTGFTVTATVTNAFGRSALAEFSISSDATMCTSCQALHQASPQTPDGTYTVDPDGSGPGQPFDVWCDMHTAGGGWTLVEKALYQENPVTNPSHSLFVDAPENEGAPEQPRHRLSKAHMAALQQVSTAMRIDCRGADHLVTSASNLFRGEGGPADCNNAGPVLYQEASLKGRNLSNVTLCTRFNARADGCSGSFHIDEHHQSSKCTTLKNYPWTNYTTPITTPDSDTFSVEPNTADQYSAAGTHDCHDEKASRYVMLR